MKRAKTKLRCVCMLVILVSITITSANDRENLVYHESPEMTFKVQDVDLLDIQADYDLEHNKLAATLFYTGCYERKRVWVWSGWFPKRVWKWVKVDCPQAAPARRGPGTTIPPH